MGPPSGRRPRLLPLDACSRGLGRIFRGVILSIPPDTKTIVLKTIEGNLSAGRRQFNGVHTQWHNRARGQRRIHRPCARHYWAAQRMGAVEKPAFSGRWRLFQSAEQHTQNQAGQTEIPKVQRRAAAPPLKHFATLPERNSVMAQGYATGS